MWLAILIITIYLIVAGATGYIFYKIYEYEQDSTFVIAILCPVVVPILIGVFVTKAIFQKIKPDIKNS